jgi:hypothetical protein
MMGMLRNRRRNILYVIILLWVIDYSYIGMHEREASITNKT